MARIRFDRGPDTMLLMKTAHEQFISERIEPCADSFAASRMATGEPGLPSVFSWRGDRYEIGRVVRQWKESSPCRHGSTERYLRKHWYLVETTDGTMMKVYFERQARSKSQTRLRWWLYTVSS